MHQNTMTRRQETPPIRGPVSDGVVIIRATEPADTPTLIAGRDNEWKRWLGPDPSEPRPAAGSVAEDTLVGWVDYDTDQVWLEPDEVNVGYNVFAPHRRRGYAHRAVQLLTTWIAATTDVQRAYLAIDNENQASLGVARALGAVIADQYVNTAGRPQTRFVISLRV
jgi:RimJ/RimL family protein N-acetyltransferase